MRYTLSISQGRARYVPEGCGTYVPLAIQIISLSSYVVRIAYEPFV